MVGTIGSRIKSLRESADISQEKLGGEALISGGYMGEIEREKATNIGIETLRKIAKALRVDLDFLLTGMVKDSNYKTIETLQKFAEELGELNRNQKRIVAKLKKVKRSGNLRAIEQFIDSILK